MSGPSLKLAPRFAWRWMAVAVLASGMLLTLGGHAAEPPGGDPPPVEAMFIVSPWDGIFYRGEYAGAIPFVEVGSRVEPETIVCTIESMRRSAISARLHGTIVQVLVEDSQMVSAGQPLFEVQPTAEPAAADAARQ